MQLHLYHSNAISGESHFLAIELQGAKFSLDYL